LKSTHAIIAFATPSFLPEIYSNSDLGFNIKEFPEALPRDILISYDFENAICELYKSMLKLYKTSLYHQYYFYKVVKINLQR